MNVSTSVWVANISTAITTIVLLVGLGKRYIVTPFQRWITEQVLESIHDLRDTVDRHSKVLELLESIRQDTRDTNERLASG